ncbi:MAG: hypothetical protein IPP71_02535 [Bacteroidetes bacterium]|nr:hypothetical protein [Bacteroidota bacterium]
MIKIIIIIWIQILQNLVSASILTSIKGSGGGFHITSTKIKSIRIISIIKAIEGDHISSSCFLGLPECSDTNPCPIHHMYAPIREQMNSQLFRTSLYDIIQDPKLKKYHLKS